MKQFSLEDYQGNPIHVYKYEPQGEIKAVVQIIHGASEHFARYGIFSEFLAKNGYLVLGCDIIGHGLSTDNYDFVHFADKFGDILAYESVLLVKEYIETNYSDYSCYLLGHSMGSFLSRKLLIDFPEFYQKAVISGTAYPPKPLIMSGIWLTKLVKFFKGPKHVSKLIQDISIDANPKKMRKDKIIGDMNEEWLTRDKIIQQYYHNSKMCGQPFTVSANLSMFKWIKFVNNKKNLNLGNKNTPLLLISGGDDALSNYGSQIESLVKVLNDLDYQNVDYIIYPNARHEVLNEINKDEVFNDVLKFFEK